MRSSVMRSWRGLLVEVMYHVILILDVEQMMILNQE